MHRVVGTTRHCNVTGGLAHESTGLEPAEELTDAEGDEAHDREVDRHTDEVPAEGVTLGGQVGRELRDLASSAQTEVCGLAGGTSDEVDGLGPALGECLDTVVHGATDGGDC